MGRRRRRDGNDNDDDDDGSAHLKGDGAKCVAWQWGLCAGLGQLTRNWVKLPLPGARGILRHYVVR